jgi:hypothetical protein
LPFRFDWPEPDGFCPCEGGTLELPGLGLEFRDPRRQLAIVGHELGVLPNQCLDARHQRRDQRILVDQIRRRSHP